MAFPDLSEVEILHAHIEPVAIPVRREPREDTVRIVEYAPFPRSDSGQRPRMGFTRDLSKGGMCVGVDDGETIGALLRVSLRGIDGRPERTAVSRVVWCSSERDGRFWLGLELMGEAAPQSA